VDVLGPCLPEQIEELRWATRSSSATLEVRSIEKLPRMADCVVPEAVRFADANRVRLTPIWDEEQRVFEGFCNFNARTLGPSMVGDGSVGAL
jgi:2,3,4,5-tetrahydropyridine-2-carboxylate N-succinyltransferase